jgi:hypothetical protein
MARVSNLFIFLSYLGPDLAIPLVYDHQCRYTPQNWGKKVGRWVGGNPDVTQQSMAMDTSLNLWLMLMTIIWK